MAITFSPRLALAGFDRAARWQMVPVKGERLLTLEGAHGLVPHVLNPKILEATQTVSGKTTLLKLEGKAPGKTAVDWLASARFPGADKAGFVLDISVKKEQPIPTAFHYVTDLLGRSTGRNPLEIDKLVPPTNAILQPQANVRIDPIHVERLLIEEDLGDVVTNAKWDAVIKHGLPKAAFNVFFVWSFEADDTPLTDNYDAATERAKKSCIFQDETPLHPAPEVLAHEVIHLLGYEDHSNDPDHLIARGPVRTGRFIPKAHADLINKTDR